MSGKKKVAILVVVLILAILAIGAIAASGPPNQDDNTSVHVDGYFDCSFVSGKSFTSSSGYTYTAPTGQIFVIAKITLKNVDYKNGIDNNPYNFKLSNNGILYTYDSSTYSYPKHSDTVTVMPGGQVSNYYLYVVPSGINGASIYWNGGSWINVKYDPSQFT